MRRFVVVGTLCVLVDFGVYSALAVQLGAGANRAKAASYLAGVIIGFALNKWWTFRSQRKNWSEPISYLLLYAATLFVNVACNHWILESMGDDQRLIAYALATGVTTVLNFLGMRMVTFRKGVADRYTDIDSPLDEATPFRKAA